MIVDQVLVCTFAHTIHCQDKHVLTLGKNSVAVLTHLHIGLNIRSLGINLQSRYQ